MVLPALGWVARIVGSAGIWTAARRGFRKAIPKARSAISNASNWLRQTLPQKWATRLGIGAGGAGGLLGGFGISELFDRLGIEDSQLQTLSVIAVIGIIVVGVGQVLDINYNA